MAFFGVFRLGEILVSPGEAYNPTNHLSMGDVAIDNTSHPIQVFLKQSKTDQFGKGAMVYIGRTYTDLCPIAAILAFMALRGNTPGPFFQQ